MSWKNILVYMDSSADNTRCLSMATRLAKQHDAHLTGLVTMPMPEPNWSLVGEGVLSKQAISDLRTFSVERTDDALAQFGLAVSKAGLESVTRVQDCPGHAVSEVISQFGRRHDLVIMAQSDTDHPRYGGNDLPDEVILNSGRPVLMVPFIDTKPIGNHVMVGWDGSRESSRAINDALPLLKQAKKVTVMMVNPIPSSIEESNPLGAGIKRHIEAHGIEVDVKREYAKDIGRENVILSRVNDLDVDMLIVGAYSTHRYREMIFGGATRTLLHEMTVPILFSH